MPDKPEDIKSFFDLRANGYDEHMASTVEDFHNFYSKIAAPFEKTDEPIQVLDLGAGTGIELEFIVDKTPNAKITTVDLSEVMLKKLVKKYETFASQIKTIADSFLSLKLEPHSFDYVVSVMSLHHLMPAKKIALYKKLRNALVPTGAYVEGDYVVSLEEEKRLLNDHNLQKKNNSLLDDGQYHIDIPFSEETQIRALKEAGFKEVSIIFHTSRSNVVVAKPEVA
jgi:tRNA (cmo5U34)-methyltransferase